jgi:CheY-like chemotaxis protein
MTIKLLVVDDNDVCCLAAELLMKKRGFEVHSVRSGEQCLEILEKNIYTAILMDISMPGMDGFSLANKIREMGGLNKDVQIFAFSVHDTEDFRERCLQSDIISIFSKPLNSDLADSIAEAVRSLVDGAQLRDN